MKNKCIIISHIEEREKDYKHKREERTPLKEVFKPFQTEVNRDIKKNFIADFKTKRNEIFSLFNTNLGFQGGAINTHQPFKTFKRGMAKALFGTNIVNGKLSLISQLFERKKVHKKTSKIDVGDLIFYDLQNQSKSTYESRVIEIKKMIFRRSRNFSILDTQHKKVPKNNALLSKSSKRPLKLRTINIFDRTNNDIRNKSRNIGKTNSKRLENVIRLSAENLTESTKQNCETQNDQIVDQYRSHTNTHFHNNSSNSNNNNDTELRRSVASPSKENHSSIFQSPTSLSLKDSRLKYITLKKEIKSMAEKHDLLEQQLFDILDKGSELRNVNKKKLKLEKITNIDFKKDLEVILDMKKRKKGKRVKAKDLLAQAIEITNKNKCKNAIIKLSDGITKMNDETALKFAENIVENYFKKTQSGKFYIPKQRKYQRIQLDMKLRHKADENYEKLQRMTFYLSKTKKRLNDEEKKYEEQKIHFQTEK